MSNELFKLFDELIEARNFGETVALAVTLLNKLNIFTSAEHIVLVAKNKDEVIVYLSNGTIVTLLKTNDEIIHNISIGDCF